VSDNLPRCDIDVRDLSANLTLEIPGRLEAIPTAVERIMGVVKTMECAEGSEFEIEVALNEALANAVKHGCCLDADKTVAVSVMCDESSGVLIVVRDPGTGFEASQVPSPVVGQRLFASHGRGIFLINRLMDEVHYERGGTEIWMRKGPRGSSATHPAVAETGEE